MEEYMETNNMGQEMSNAPRTGAELMVLNYPKFGKLTLIYAVVYSFCLYHNGSGITFPIFTAATLLYFYLCFQELNLGWKKDSFWYVIAIELLGISTFLTGDGRLIRLNKIGIFLLLICFLLHTVYEDRKWNFTKYVGAFFTTIFMAFSCIGKPLSDRAAYRKAVGGRKKTVVSEQMKYVLTGLAICIPLVLIVIALLAGADAIFADIFRKIFQIRSFVQLTADVFWIVLLTVAVFFAAYMLVAYLCRKQINENVAEPKRHEPIIAITIAVVLGMIYLTFCAIQIRYLFLGSLFDSVSLPEGMTYSRYARSGFFQLLFVCILNLIIVLIGRGKFRESRVLQVMLCVITGCTYIMIASSAMRMLLYIQYKYPTFLRIIVLWSLSVIALLFVGVLISIWKKEFPLFRYGVFIVTLCYLLLSFGKPDYWIAKVNIDNMYEETQYSFFEGTKPYHDYVFLSEELGTDAAPFMIDKDSLEEYEDWNQEEYFAEKEFWKAYSWDRDDWEWRMERKEDYMKDNWRSIYLYRMEGETENIGIRNFNLSRFMARVPE